MKKSTKVGLTIAKPKKLFKMYDIKTDSFKNEEINESYSLKNNSCLDKL